MLTGIHPICFQLFSVLCVDGQTFGLNDSPDSLVYLRTDEDFAFRCGAAITRGSIYCVAAHGEFHPLGGAYKSVHDFTTVNTDTKPPARAAPNISRFI